MRSARPLTPAQRERLHGPLAILGPALLALLPWLILFLAYEAIAGKLAILGN